MLTRDGYPLGVPCWIDTAQPDPEAAARFYRGVFGWELEERMPPETPGSYLVARLEGCDVAAVGSQQAPRAPVWTTYVRVGDADAAAQRARAAGGTVLAEPFDVLAAGRMAVLADPAGAELAVWQAGEQRGAQLVNAPGTWNWSTLASTDLDGAVAFYGAVFGWKGDRVDLGFGESVMWRVPGYGDALAARDPDVRRRHAEAGAPAGFTDAVGWLVPTSDGASHWDVTFSVADTDAVVARAEELGGEVVVAPYDAGPVRAASLRDPQGAPFDVNAYTPPA